jgi:cation diffusion facilitator CzcD-associated flavoprotein CzcO
VTGNMERVETVIIGGGHAGLTMSYYLSQHEREHVVLERAEWVNAGRSERWDSFHFQFPKWTIELPGLNTSATIRTPSRRAMRLSDSSMTTRPSLKPQCVAGLR